MPGLVGFTGNPNAEFPRDVLLRRMRDSITHRPGYAHDTLFCNEQICATRSHLGLLQRETQPYCEGRLHVWMEGEFHNQHELRQRLTKVAESDPAILLGLVRESLERRDFSLLAKIDGIYAAVVHDAEGRRVMLLNDRYGLRPLYWGICKRQLVWTSEQKALAEIPGAATAIDPVAAREFLDTGTLLGDRSWFPELQLLAPATLLSWDIEGGKHREQHYWSPQQIRPAVGPFDERELSAEIGRRFATAVRLRAPVSDRVGLRLDGELESRALFAAIPHTSRALHTTSVGGLDSDDLKIIARAAAVRGAEHHVLELQPENWLDSHRDAVWWTDGQLDLLHMHDAGVIEAERRLYDFQLSDFPGVAIAGGTGLTLPSAGENEAGENEAGENEAGERRGRRLLSRVPRLAGVALEQRLPFLANDLFELLLSLPFELRADAHLYHRTLLERWPDYFRNIPRRTTGLPIGLPRPLHATRRSLLVLRRRARLAVAGRPWSEPSHDPLSLQLLREAPVRSVFEDLLMARDPAIGEFVDPGEVKTLWLAHSQGADHSKALGRLATLELWLNQILRGRHRPDPAR